MKYRIFIMAIFVTLFFTACDLNMDIDFAGEAGDRTICGKVTDKSTGYAIENAVISIYFYQSSFGGNVSSELLSTTYTEPSGYFSTTFYSEGAGMGESYCLYSEKSRYKTDKVTINDDNNHYFTIKLEKVLKTLDLPSLEK